MERKDKKWFKRDIIVLISFLILFVSISFLVNIGKESAFRGSVTLPAQLGQLETGQDGKGLLRIHLWCPDDLPRLWDRIEISSLKPLGQFLTKFHLEPPGALGMKMYSNRPCRLANMAAMLMTYGKNVFEIFTGTNWSMVLNLNI